MNLINTVALSSDAAGPPGNEVDFAVVTTVTTGLRTIEIAALRIRTDGSVVDQFSSLVNPGYNIDPGPNAGDITRAQLDVAPPLSAIFGHIGQILSGSVLATYDLFYVRRILAWEFARIGVRLPALPAISIRATARDTLRLSNYRLPTVARELRLPGYHADTALGAAEVSAQVLSALVNRYELGFAELPDRPEIPRWLFAEWPLVRTQSVGARAQVL